MSVTLLSGGETRDGNARAVLRAAAMTYVSGSLMSLLKQKLITFEEALRQCSNPDDFKLKVSGVSSTSDLSWDAFEGDSDEGEQ